MDPHRVSRPAEAGFTMIEVMIAILLTMVAVMGIVGLVTVETRGGTTSRHTTEAAVLAEGQMEVLRTQTITASGGPSSDASPVDPQGVVGATGSIYTRSWIWTVSTTVISYNVTVSWAEDGPGTTGCPTAGTRCVTLYSQRDLTGQQ
jgi:Tfp pilus assembly protein PilV